MAGRASSLSARLLPNGLLDALRQVLLVALGYYAYRVTRGLVDDPTSAVVAYDHARGIISVEQSLHVFIEPHVQHFAETVPGLDEFTSWMYVNAQSTVTLGALIFLYVAHNRSFYFVRNMFMVAGCWPSSATSSSRPRRRGSCPSGASPTASPSSPASTPAAPR